MRYIASLCFRFGMIWLGSILSLLTCFAWAFEPSPAGGGCLEVSKPGGYAFVENHDDFDGERARWLKDASGNGHTLTDVDLAYFHVRSRGKLPTLWGKIKKR